jgi:hypothetical protein
MDTKWYAANDSKKGEFEKLRKHSERENNKTCFFVDGFFSASNEEWI